MIFEREGAEPTTAPTPEAIASELAQLSSAGPSSFAHLTNPSGDYVQVAGGGGGCLIERRDAETGRHYRAYQATPVVPFEDNTALVFSGGRIPLKADEWFRIVQVTEVFVAFLRGSPFPGFIGWREMTEMFDRRRS